MEKTQTQRLEHITPVTGTRYSVVVDGRTLLVTESFEEAARMWDRETYLSAAPQGGIGVKSYQNGYTVRDGWLVHVGTNGSVYINPSMYATT